MDSYGVEHVNSLVGRVVFFCTLGMLLLTIFLTSLYRYPFISMPYWFFKGSG